MLLLRDLFCAKVSSEHSRRAVTINILRKNVIVLRHVLPATVLASDVVVYVFIVWVFLTMTVLVFRKPYELDFGLSVAKLIIKLEI